jgi:hypothetical protein
MLLRRHVRLEGAHARGVREGEPPLEVALTRESNFGDKRTSISQDADSRDLILHALNTRVRKQRRRPRFIDKC